MTKPRKLYFVKKYSRNSAFEFKEIFNEVIPQQVAAGISKISKDCPVRAQQKYDNYKDVRTEYQA